VINRTSVPKYFVANKVFAILTIVLLATPLTPSAQDHLTSLKNLLHQGNMKQFEARLIEVLRTKSAPMDRSSFLKEVCNLLGTLPVSEAASGQDFYESVAVDQLEAAPELPMKEVFNILICIRETMPLRLDATNQRSSDWSHMRARKAKLWLKLHQRIEQSPALVPAPEDLPSVSVAPPKITGLPSGVAPEEISDPKLRREYERAIKENQMKAQRLSEMRQLAVMRRGVQKYMPIYLAEAYSHPPAAIHELTAMLEQYVNDVSLRTSILAATQRSNQTK
jgi:hypothetical protein